MKRRKSLSNKVGAKRMSVYCLGKLKGRKELCRSFLQAAAVDAGVGLTFDVDPEDEHVLEESEDLKGDGVTFAVGSQPGDPDVVKAWNAARDVGLEKLKSFDVGSSLPDCRTNLDDFSLPEPVQSELAKANLGKFASAVIGFDEISAGGLAFFDGSIRQIVPGSRDWCLRRILAGFLVPWDCGPDALYVWIKASVARS